LTHAAVVSSRRATGIQGTLDVVEALFEGRVVGVDFEAFLALGVVSVDLEWERWDLLGEYCLLEFSEPMQGCTLPRMSLDKRRIQLDTLPNTSASPPIPSFPLQTHLIRIL
jgi:hypothetical protein